MTDNLRHLFEKFGSKAPNPILISLPKLTGLKQVQICSFPPTWASICLIEPPATHEANESVGIGETNRDTYHNTC